MFYYFSFFFSFFFQSEDCIRDLVRSRVIGDVYKRQAALRDPALQAKVPDLEFAHTVLVLGTEPIDDAPILELRIRKGVRRNNVQLAVATARPSALDPKAAATLRIAPGAAPRFAAQLAQAPAGADARQAVDEFRDQRMARKQFRYPEWQQDDDDQHQRLDQGFEMGGRADEGTDNQVAPQKLDRGRTDVFDNAVGVVHTDRKRCPGHVDEEENVTYPIQNNVADLALFSTPNRNVDLMGHIVFDENDREIFNFGKYKGKAVEEIFTIEPQYYDWIMKSQFPQYTKKIVDKIWQRVKANNNIENDSTNKA